MTIPEYFDYDISSLCFKKTLEWTQALLVINFPFSIVQTPEISNGRILYFFLILSSSPNHPNHCGLHCIYDFQVAEGSILPLILSHFSSHFDELENLNGVLLASSLIITKQLFYLSLICVPS